MQLIFLDRHNRSHTIKISNFIKFLTSFLLLTSFILIYVFGYYRGFDKNLDYNTQKQWINSWQEELLVQKKSVANFKIETKMHLDAFSEQIAKLQAHISRLDALGLHLSKIANLEPELFNFSSNLSENDLHNTDIIETDKDTEKYLENNIDNKNNDFLTVFDELDKNIFDLDRQLNTLQSVLKYQKLDRQTLVKGKPIKKGYISSYYGYRNHPILKRRILHRGIDFAGKHNSDILAVASGVVSWADKRGGYGNLVEINHGDGYLTRYAHNNEILVSVGDLVNKGDHIARMGNTGKATGTHLHFEVWKNGRPENPITYLSKK